jgi:hypothetical protein
MRSDDEKQGILNIYEIFNCPSQIWCFRNLVNFLFFQLRMKMGYAIPLLTAILSFTPSYSESKVTLQGDGESSHAKELLQWKVELCL